MVGQRRGVRETGGQRDGQKGQATGRVKDKEADDRAGG